MVIASLLAAGCGDDDDDADAARTTDAPVTTDADVTDAPVVTVNAVDFAFEDLPASVPAGTTIELVNSSTIELHEIVVLGPLPADETRSVDELLALPEDESPPVEPVLVILAPPGGDTMTPVGDGTLTEPGRYAVICAIPTGADPAEFMAAAATATDGPPAVDGGPPHFVNGMFAELVVV